MHVNTFLEPHKSYPFYRIAKFSLFSKGSAKRFGSVQPYMFGLRVRFGSAIVLEKVRFGRTSKSKVRPSPKFSLYPEFLIVKKI